MPTSVSSCVIETLVARLSPYLPTDPIDSILREIASHLATIPGIADAIVGWPEHPDALDLASGPVVSVSYAMHREEQVPPSTITGADLWRLGRLTVTVQVDLWASYRAERDTGARALVDGWDNRLPYNPGLFLTSRGYHSRPVQAYLDRGSAQDSADGVAEGAWRRSWMAEAVSDIVRDASGTPNQTETTLRPTVDDVLQDDHVIT